MSPHSATFREALAALDLMLGHVFPFMTVEVREQGRIEHLDHRCCVAGFSVQRLAWLIEHLETTRDATVSLLAPERDRGKGQAGATFLMVRVAGDRQVQAVRRLPCAPSMSLKEGSSSRRTLLWWLRDPANYFDVQDANRKLAFAVGATQRHGVPENIRIPAPGSCVRESSRPRPIVVARLALGAFELGHVIEGLREPPPADAWLKNQIGASV